MEPEQRGVGEVHRVGHVAILSWGWGTVRLAVVDEGDVRAAFGRLDERVWGEAGHQADLVFVFHLLSARRQVDLYVLQVSSRRVQRQTSGGGGVPL